MTRRATGKILFIFFMVLSALAALAVPAPAPAAETALYSGQPAKYVFFFIGDGMAQPQRTSTEMYLAAKEGKPHGSVKLTMSEFPAQGLMTTHAANSIIPDSADTATAMACGVKTNSGMLGVTPDGKRAVNVSEQAKQKGMKVGIISTVSIDHATPAGFYAHQLSRDYYHEIGHGLANSGFDFFGGGGLKDPTGKKAKDGKPQGDVVAAAKAAGYKIVTGKEDFLKLKKEDGKVIVFNEWLQDSKAMPYMIDRSDKDLNLADLVAKAAEMLDGPQGFFIMAEAGKVDWACHANDAVSTVTDMLDLDRGIQAALKFREKHPDETMILVAGDHECGGLTIGFAGTKYNNFFNILDSQKTSFTQFSDKILADYKKSHAANYKFDDVKPLITASFGLKFEGDEKDRLVLDANEVKQVEAAFERSMKGEEEASKDQASYLLYGGYEPLTVTVTHILNQKAGLGWTSYSHTGVPVTVSAIGVGAESFNGYYDNTDIAKKLRAVMGLPTDAQVASN
ncbi:MAG: alkaline phosphatase [Pseudomonadota bacterium]